MKSRYGLIPPSSLIVGGSVMALIIAITFFAFNSYVFQVRRDADALLHDAVVSVAHAHGSGKYDAVQAGKRFLPSSYYRHGIFTVFVDGEHRVSIVNGRMNVRARVDRSGEPYAAGTFPHVIAGLAVLCGLQKQRATIGDLEIDVGLDEPAFSASVHAYAPFLAAAGVCVLLVSIVSARMLTKQAMRPLLEVTLALEHLADGDFRPQFVSVQRQSALRTLASAYNRAAEQVQCAFQERDRAHASMERFIADAGHQLRTPLTVIRGYIGILRQGETRDLSSILQEMNNQCLIIGALLERLILLEQWEEEDPDPAGVIPLGELVEEIVAPIAQSHPHRLIDIEVRDTVHAAVDPGDFRHAITNIIENAMKYTTGPIIVKVRAEGERALVEIADEGPGMKPEQAQRAFDRFFRGDRRDVEGSGLGLAIAKRAVERAHGSIVLETGIDRGSCFTIAFPHGV